MTSAIWRSLGVRRARSCWRNGRATQSENAIFTRDLVQPQPGQTWVLVTSAWHMPRAVETFERNGWTGLVPWPVDFRSGGQALRLEWSAGRPPAGCRRR
jgi:uncharacterized SAM-binding protein YcdF (DUF218 family)